MKKVWLILLGVFILLPAFLLACINTPPGRSAFSSLASRWSGRDVSLKGAIYPTPSWPPGLHVSSLTIANVQGGRDPNMAEIGILDISVRPKALLRGRFKLHQLSLVDSTIHLERDKEGNANWSLSEPKAADGESPPPTLGTLYFRNSVLTYLDVPKDTDLRLAAVTEEDHFILSGDGRHLGKGFALKGDMAASCLAHHKKSCPLDITLTVGHTSLSATGSVNALEPPKDADLKLDIKGADAAELFPLFGIALPPTEPYHLAGHLTYENERWHFDDFTGTMGESDLAGKATWDTSLERPKLTATFVSKQLRFIDLGPLIGRAPKTQVSQQQKERAAQQEASPRVIPDIPLDISKLQSMDADVEFTGKQVISDTLPLDDFYMKLSLDDLLMTLKPVRFGTAQGNISADITVNARQTPVADRVDIHFDKLTLAGLLGSVGKKLGDIEPPQGDIGGTMALSGHGKSLHEIMSDAHGVAGLGMEGGSISNLLVKLLSLDIARSLGFLLTGDKPLAIRCVVADFDVDHGVMTTDNFVIDTADTNISGEGTVNLGSEEMALRIEPAPKKSTLLSLRSPIDIKGTLKKPSVVLEKGPLATRGAIATGLATVAPVAAVVAFLGPGTGKDSDCAALMQAMHEKTGKTAKTDEIPKNQ